MNLLFSICLLHLKIKDFQTATFNFLLRNITFVIYRTSKVFLVTHTPKKCFAKLKFTINKNELLPISQLCSLKIQN